MVGLYYSASILAGRALPRTCYPCTPLCGNFFMDFSYMHASSANLEALYRIELLLKPLVSAAARQQGTKGAGASLTPLIKPFNYTLFDVYSTFCFITLS